MDLLGLGEGVMFYENCLLKQQNRTRERAAVLGAMGETDVFFVWFQQPVSLCLTCAGVACVCVVGVACVCVAVTGLYLCSPPLPRLQRLSGLLDKA